ncbi:MAG TPA: CDGSH iron-sulfur domain-containing protein [Nitrospirota bacterium]|nr:CDGSH iron-sulfur domain-containing protein [Nitrospirota bacterium]
MSNPFIKELEPGTHTRCACGRSKTSPFCDGSHKETAKQPLQFAVTENKKAALCNCARTSTPPYCDGSHQTK